MSMVQIHIAHTRMNWTGNRPPNVYGQQYPRYPQTSAQPPYLEVQASEAAPYVQQTIIYTFRIVSSGNLQSVNPILPSHESITLKKIDGPIPTSRHRGGRQEIVNEFRFELTVLRSGEISIPPLRVTGARMPSRQTYSFGRGPTYQGESFDVTAKGPLVLQVKPAHSSVRPWLPLHDLHIEGKVDSQQVIQPGKPLSLSISMTAEGGAADHIPSLESQLKAAGFRIYKESIKTRDTISADGKRLVGHREEVYTLRTSSCDVLKTCARKTCLVECRQAREGIYGFHSGWWSHGVFLLPRERALVSPLWLRLNAVCLHRRSETAFFLPSGRCY